MTERSVRPSVEATHSPLYRLDQACMRADLLLKSKSANTKLLSMIYNAIILHSRSVIKSPFDTSAPSIRAGVNYLEESRPAFVAAHLDGIESAAKLLEAKQGNKGI